MIGGILLFLMNKVSCLFFLLFLDILLIIIYTFPRIIKRNKPHIDFRFLLLSFFAICSAALLYLNKEKQNFYFYKPSNYDKHGIVTAIIFFSSNIAYNLYVFYERFSRQKLDNIFSYTFKYLKSVVTKTFIIDTFIYSAIEEIIFRASFCNLLLYSKFRVFETVIISSVLFSLSKLYYMFTSPAFMKEGMNKLIKRTFVYMLYSFIYAVCTNYIYCMSHSLHSIYIINIIYNYVDNPLLFDLWNCARDSPFQIIIRVLLVFGYIYFFSIILMFNTTDSV